MVASLATVVQWMVSQAQRFIDEAVNIRQQPFFLYFAATLVHGPDVSDALNNFDYSMTPKGVLGGDEIPDDTAMMTRSQILDSVEGDDDLELAGIWMDDVRIHFVFWHSTKSLFCFCFLRCSAR